MNTKIDADNLMECTFLNQQVESFYKADVKRGHIFLVFSGIIVRIACLGLFGLSSFTIVQRTKEIGIRKVFGASVLQIVRLLSHDFAKVIVLASLLALPIAYFVIDQWLSNYAIRINLNFWIFTIPILTILIIAMLTVSLQTIKTALANPVDSLRNE